MENLTKIYIFHVPGLPHNNKIATVVASRNNDNTYSFGLAIRSPHDNFCRREGVAKARGRLVSTPYRNYTPYFGKLKLIEHIGAVIQRHGCRNLFDFKAIHSYFDYMQKFLENKTCISTTQKKN